MNISSAFPDLLVTRAEGGHASSTAEMIRPAIFTDKSESSVEDRHDQWNPLFENTSIGVALTNSEYRFLTGNAAFLKMLNRSLGELQQLSFFDICLDENRNEYEMPLRELRDGTRLQCQVETRYLCKDGSSFPVHTYVSAVDGATPTQLTFLIVTVNVSARQAADDALRLAQADLSRVARLTTVGAMAGSIAHEINQLETLGMGGTDE